MDRNSRRMLECWRALKEALVGQGFPNPYPQTGPPEDGDLRKWIDPLKQFSETYYVRQRPELRRLVDSFLDAVVDRQIDWMASEWERTAPADKLIASVGEAIMGMKPAWTPEERLEL